MALCSNLIKYTQRVEHSKIGYICVYTVFNGCIALAGIFPFMQVWLVLVGGFSRTECNKVKRTAVGSRGFTEIRCPSLYRILLRHFIKANGHWIRLTINPIGFFPAFPHMLCHSSHFWRTQRPQLSFIAHTIKVPLSILRIYSLKRF